VALVQPDHQSQLLSRKFICTGLTRAKQRLRCLGSDSAWRAEVAARFSSYALIIGQQVVFLLIFLLEKTAKTVSSAQQAQVNLH
jgi:hypothetical protein